MLFTQINQLDPRRYIPRVPPENRGELAICIFIAFLFWLIVSLTTKDHSVTKAVEIEFSVGEDEVLIEPLTATAEATISGPGWELMWSNVFQPVIKVAYHRNSSGSKVVNQVELSAKVTEALYSNETSLTQLIFLPIILKVEPKDNKRVPIVSKVNFEFQQGHSPKSELVLSPDSVTVWGATSLLESLEYWPTDTISITDVKESIQRTIKLKKGQQGLRPAIREVSLSQEVEVITEKSFYVPVQVINPPAQDSFSIFPKQVRLTVGVLKSDYGAINASDFRLVADLNGMRTEDGRNIVTFVLDSQPRQARRVEFNPKAAEFFLFRKE